MFKVVYWSHSINDHIYWLAWRSWAEAFIIWQRIPHYQIKLYIYWSQQNLNPELLFSPFFWWGILGPKPLLLGFIVGRSLYLKFWAQAYFVRGYVIIKYLEIWEFYYCFDHLYFKNNSLYHISTSALHLVYNWHERHNQWISTLLEDLISCIFLSILLKNNLFLIVHAWTCNL